MKPPMGLEQTMIGTPKLEVCSETLMTAFQDIVEERRIAFLANLDRRILDAG